MNYNFKLLENVEKNPQYPNQIVKKRFGPLSLSTKKVNKPSEIKEIKEIMAKKSTIQQIELEKNLDNSLITDDESENDDNLFQPKENTPLGNIMKSPVFIDTNSLNLSIINYNHVDVNPFINVTQSFSDKLQVSETDETSTSPLDIDSEIFRITPQQNVCIEMKKLEIEKKFPQESENIFNTNSFNSNPFIFSQKNDKKQSIILDHDINKISTQMEVLELDKPKENPARYSILTISSTRSEEILNTTTESNLAIDKIINADPIVISDSDSSYFEDTNPNISTMDSKEKSLSKTAVEKIDAFFNNIPASDISFDNSSSYNHLIHHNSSDQINNLKNPNHTLPTTVENTMNSEFIPKCSPHFFSPSSVYNTKDYNTLATTVDNTIDSHHVPVNISTTTDDDIEKSNDEIRMQNVKENKVLTESISSCNEIPTETPNSIMKTQKSESVQSEKLLSLLKNKLIESINISAKININIQISHHNSSSSSDNSSSDDSNNASSSSFNNKKPIDSSLSDKKEETPNTAKSSTNDGKHVQDEEEEVVTEPEIINKSKSLPKPEINENLNKSNFEIDDDMQEILNSVYGNEWQTPDILKKCSVRKKKLSQINLNHVETQDPNFSIFHKNIRSDLESTRINDNLSKSTKRMDKKSTIQDNKKRTNRKLNLKKKLQKNDDEENISDSTFTNLSSSSSQSSSLAQSSDSSFKISSLDDSVSPIIKTCTKKKNNLTKHPKLKEKKKLFGMDRVEIIQSDDEGDSSTDSKQNNKHFADDSITKKTKAFLEDCEFKKKASVPSTPINFKIPSTEVKRTKRKLFTPNYDIVELQSNAQIETNKKDNDKDNIIHLTEPIPRFLIKQLELFQNRKQPMPNATTTTSSSVALIETDKKTTSAKVTTPTPAPTQKKTATVKTLDKKSTKSSDKEGLATPKRVQQIIPVTSQTKPRPVLKSIDGEDERTYGFLKSLDIMISKNICHPDALYYRNNYASKKVELSQILFNLYNEKVFDNKLIVPIIWNKKLLNTAGRCINSKRGSILSSKIELSDKVLTSADRLRCTLIHEMCHASTWVFNEENGHGQTWKQWASKAMTIFPELPKIGVCHRYDIEYKYTYQCVQCEAKSFAHSKSKKIENIRCSYCHGSIKIFINKKNKEGEIIQTPVREASGFAKFVKDNYKDFKRPNCTHAEVMKLLGAEFASLKVDNPSKK